MSHKHKLDYIFHPETAAVAGVSSRPNDITNVFFKLMYENGFGDRVYPINKNSERINGIICYKSLTDIPGPVDYVLACFRAAETIDLIKECAAKKVKVCSIFSAGFSEVGTEEGIRIEREVVRVAKEAGIRLVGPNCMGIYCPASGMYLSSNLDNRSGNFGIISQSGGNSTYLTRVAPRRGARISKAVSYGNGCDINESDLLEYFTEDEETKVIGAYIEGVKEPERFKKALNRAASEKPVIILKGGRTETGSAIAASHTGSLAGSASAWNAVISQAGAMQVDDLDEMIDLALMHLYVKPPEGRNVCMIGIGGGISVLASDYLNKVNLYLPPFSRDTRMELVKLTRDAGHIFTNPVDTQAMMWGQDDFKGTLKVLEKSDNIDMFFIQLSYDILGIDLDFFLSSGRGDMVVQRMLEGAVDIKKPRIMILHHASLPETYQNLFINQQRCWEKGVPAFMSLHNAARAMDRFITYHERRSRRIK